MSTPSLSRDGRLRIDKSLTIWDAVTGAVIRQLTNDGRKLTASAVAMSADGSYAISCGTDNATVLWNVASATVIKWFSEELFKADEVALSADGRTAAFITPDNELASLELYTGDAYRLKWASDGRLQSLALSTDGRRVVAGLDCRTPVPTPGAGWRHPADSPLLVWDFATRAPSRQLDGHGGGITAISLSPDGRRAVTCALDCTVIYWDLDTGKIIRRLTGHKGWLHGVALSPDERHAISGGAERNIVLWDLKSGLPVGQLYLDGPINGLDWAGNWIRVSSNVMEILELQS
jgi:WD40 repeat protein